MLKRSTWMKRRRSKPRRTSRVRNPAFKRAVRGLPCLFAGVPPVAGPCWGPIDPDHLDKHAAGATGDDTSCVPMCRGHHSLKTDRAGYFANRTDDWWDLWKRRAWARTALLLHAKGYKASVYSPASRGGDDECAV
jgi:hypothetical protein